MHASRVGKKWSRVVGVPYGLGGLPLRAADLAGLLGALDDPDRSLVYLGVDFIRAAPGYPQRQALMDALWIMGYPQPSRRAGRHPRPVPGEGKRSGRDVGSALTVA